MAHAYNSQTPNFSICRQPHNQVIPVPVHQRLRSERQTAWSPLISTPAHLLRWLPSMMKQLEKDKKARMSVQNLTSASAQQVLNETFS